MTTENALLAAVLAAPDDDLPRLVYADWLEENGQPERAEFIRVQCDLAKDHALDASCSGIQCQRCYEISAMRRRQANLLGFGPGGHRRNDDSNWFKWAGYAALIVPRRDVQGFVTGMFRRGFVSEVRCTLAEWCGSENRTCTRCNYAAEHPWEDRCPSCNSHRILQYPQGIGLEVVRRHPVERVVLTDVVTVSTLPSLSIVRQHTARELFTIAFPSENWVTARPGYVEGKRETLEKRISAAALLWAKSQPDPARISTSPVSVDVTD